MNIKQFTFTTTLISELDVALSTSQGVLERGIDLNYCDLPACRNIEERVNDWSNDCYRYNKKKEK